MILFMTSHSDVIIIQMSTSSVATAGFFPPDLGIFDVFWVSGYFCQ